MDSIQIIEQLYASYCGERPAQAIALPSSGSHRQYFRLKGQVQLIGVVGTSKEENEAFIYLDKFFLAQGLNVPQVVAVSQDKMSYLQNDLGEESLFDFLSRARSTNHYGVKEKEILYKVMTSLVDFQFSSLHGLDFRKCYPPVNFDKRSIMWDLNYFKYCFLKASGLDFLEDKLEDDFQSLATELMQVDSDTFMYRDFQSRNIMIHEGEPYFIDFQGGRKGPFYYDVASFLWQAKACYPKDLRQELIDVYINALQKYHKIDKDKFKANLHLYVLFRIIQVLGAYGFRGYFERKQHFLESIPYAIANLKDLIQEPFANIPYLTRLLQQLVELPKFSPTRKNDNLVVRVYSFSYKRGIPEDTTGNGGGFVFDCRAIHNPGRYAEYKSFTGLDLPVIEFIEKNGEVVPFLDNCYGLVDSSVERYLKRHFTNLQISFGCTGGQHRSVYCAQKMAEHISKKYGVKVELIHRERDLSQTFESDSK